MPHRRISGLCGRLEHQPEECVAKDQAGLLADHLVVLYLSRIGTEPRGASHELPLTGTASVLMLWQQNNYVNTLRPEPNLFELEKGT